MFEATAARVFQTDAAQVIDLLPRAVYESTLVHVAQMQPYIWRGRSFGTVWGFYADVTVHTMTTTDGTSVSVTVGAELSPNAIVAIFLATMTCVPGALLLAVLAYHDFSSRRVAVAESIFMRLSAVTGRPALPVAFAPAWPAFGAAPPPGPAPPPR